MWPAVLAPVPELTCTPSRLSAIPTAPTGPFWKASGGVVGALGNSAGGMAALTGPTGVTLTAFVGADNPLLPAGAGVAALAGVIGVTGLLAGNVAGGTGVKGAFAVTFATFGSSSCSWSTCVCDACAGSTGSCAFDG